MLMCRCCVESLDVGNFDQIQCIVGGSGLIPAVQLDQLLRYTYMCTFQFTSLVTWCSGDQ